MADIKDPENTILMELKDGTVTIELLADVAPQHTARMKELARAGAYDNVVFHRVIDGFMAQTGDVAHGNFEEGFNLGRALRPSRRLPGFVLCYQGLMVAERLPGGVRDEHDERATYRIRSAPCSGTPRRPPQSD